MMKINLEQDKNTGNKLYIKMLDANADRLDDIAIKVLRNDLPDFIMPIQIKTVDGEPEIRFDMTSSGSLKLSFMEKTMTKQKLALLLKNLRAPYENCDDWMLNHHNFVLDENYILVDKDDMSVKYIYIPYAEDVKTNEEIIRFFEDFIIQRPVTDDPTYGMSLFKVLREGSFNLMGLLDKVSEDALTDAPEAVVPPQPVYTPPVQPEQNPPAQPPQPEKVEQEPPVEPAKEDENFWDQFGKDKGKGKEEKEKEEKEKGGLIGGLIGGIGKKTKEQKEPKEHKKINIFGGKGDKDGKDGKDGKGGEQPPAQPPQPTRLTPPKPVDTEDVTVIKVRKVPDASSVRLQLVDNGGYNFPQLIELDMSKGKATIGRYDKLNNPHADYNFDKSFTHISKTHLCVERIGKEIRITDMGSGNGTFINGKQILANASCTVTPGDLINLAELVTYKLL